MAICTLDRPHFDGPSLGGFHPHVRLRKSAGVSLEKAERAEGVPLPADTKQSTGGEFSNVTRRTALTAGALAAILAAVGTQLVVDPDPRAFAADAWGGYQNGRIPLETLALIPWTANQSFNPNRRLRKDAFQALNAMNDSFKKAFGRNLPINDGYRSYDEQVQAKQQYGGEAAEPGYSNHGWAVAIDVGTVSQGRIGFDSSEYSWLKSNAGKYGWVHPPWAEPNGRIPEPWHWEYNGSYTATTPVETEEDDVFKPRFVRINDASAPNGLNGLVAFFFPDRVVRTQNVAQILSLGRAWGVLKPGQNWVDVVDDLNYGEYIAGETEINNSRTTTRTEYVNAIKAALG